MTSGSTSNSPVSARSPAPPAGSSTNSIPEGNQASKSLGRGLGANFRKLAERIEGTSSALAQFARGIGFLSAGNEDLEKFVKTLATIKSVADIGVGTVKMFSNLAKMLTVVKDRQELNTEKQTLAQKKTEAHTAAVRAYVHIA